MLFVRTKGKNLSLYRCCVVLCSLLFVLAALPVQGQGTATSPSAIRDKFYLVDGKFLHQLVDDSGGLHNVSADLSRVEVILNDRILGKN